MAREKKTQVVDALAEELSRSQIVVITDYRGLKAKEMTALRREIGRSQSRFRVVKNTLATLAARKAKKDKLESMLAGPVALALGYGDVSQTVKAILDYARTTGITLAIKGAMVGDRVMGKSEAQAIAFLPSREVLLAQFAGGLKSPLQRLHYVASAPLRGLVGVLQARARQMETGAKPFAG